MVISQGDVWWADLAEPAGSGPGYRRPVVVVQGESFNRSSLHTVVAVPLTSNLRWADAPGNVRLASRSTGLDRDSVANVSQLVALDRGIPHQQDLNHHGIGLVLIRHNDLDRIRPYVDELRDAVTSVVPGTVVHVTPQG